MGNLPEAQKAAAQLKKLSALRPSLALVLGSGFGSLADAVTVNAQISYSKLSGFRPTGVGGHRGELLLGTITEEPVLVLSGRIHYYEGCSMEEVTYPIRVLASFGIKSLVLTNAAGGINSRYRPGDFMIFSDHINFMGVSPLRGGFAADSSRFVDLTRAYDPELNRLLRKAARRASVTVHAGNYLAVSGPNYETPAEIRAFHRLGADAVGMSTVPEVIVARQCGLRVAAVACIANRAAGSGGEALSHESVLRRVNQAGIRAGPWLRRFVELYAQEVACGNF